VSPPQKAKSRPVRYPYRLEVRVTRQERRAIIAHARKVKRSVSRYLAGVGTFLKPLSHPPEESEALLYHTKRVALDLEMLLRHWRQFPTGDALPISETLLALKQVNRLLLRMRRWWR
jgi:hypothetical protein